MVADIRSLRLLDCHGHYFPADKDLIKYSRKNKFAYVENCSCGNDVKYMMKKDVHPPEADFPRPVDPEFSDAEKREALLNHYGIDKQVLLPVPTVYENSRPAKEALEYHKMQNNALAKVADDYSKFIAFSVVPMQDVDLAIKEMERSKNDLKMSGVEINTMFGDELIDSERLVPFWEAAQDLDYPVFVHPWNMPGTNRFWLQHMAEMASLEQKSMTSFLEGGVLEKFPRLRVMFAHGGGNYFWNGPRTSVGRAVRPDQFKRNPSYKNLEVSGEKGTFWVDSNVFSADNLDLIFKRCGDEGKISVGTDCTFPLGPAPSNEKLKEEVSPYDIFMKSSLTFAQKKAILWKNGTEWLGFDPSI